MTLKTFSTNNTATDAEVNAAINDNPSTFLHAMTSLDVHFSGKTGQSKFLVASIPLHPVCGDHLALFCQAYVTSGTGEFWVELVQGANRDELWNVGSIVGTSPPSPAQSTIVNMTTLTNAGDVTGKDCTLEIYMNEACRMKSIRVWSGDASAVTDYGG